MKLGVRLSAMTLAFALLSVGPATAAGKLKENCKDEITKFCSTSTGGALLACLSAKKAELSDNCKKNVEMKAAEPPKKK